MPYIGKNLKKNGVLVQAKLHGPDIIHVKPARHTEKFSIINDLLDQEISDEEIAEYLAHKLAYECRNDEEVVWVQIDVATSSGESFGYTKLLDENANTT